MIEYNNAHSRRAPHCTGFTLIEALLVISIIATILAIAIPNFTTLIENTRIRTQVSLLHATLHSARNYALTTQSVVIVCAAAGMQKEKCNGDYSSNTNWKDGWIVYEDKNRNNKLDTQDSVLNVSSNANVATVFNQRGRLRFFPDGSARSAGFYICTANSESGWHVKLLHTGRARTQRNLGEKQHEICRSKA